MKTKQVTTSNPDKPKGKKGAKGGRRPKDASLVGSEKLTL
ncbi:hypothetical protein BH09BAC4_BH09BAC4_06700 [soil metagenome]